MKLLSGDMICVRVYDMMVWGKRECTHTVRMKWDFFSNNDSWLRSSFFVVLSLCSHTVSLHQMIRESVRFFSVTWIREKFSVSDDVESTHTHSTYSRCWNDKTEQAQWTHR